MAKLTVEIPEAYLMQIAVYGKMGTGELADIIQTWAQNELRKAGLGEKFKEKQIKHLNQLHQSLRNVLGDEIVSQMDSKIAKAAVLIKQAKL